MKLWTFIFGVVSLFSVGRAEACDKKFVTFNAALTPRVEHYEERRALIPSVISELDADVVCMQELWFGGDLEAVVEKNKNIFPFSYSALHDEEGGLDIGLIQKPPCGPSNYYRIWCAFMKCSGSESENDFIVCAKDECKIERLDQSCLTCVSLVGMSNFASRCIGTLSTTMNIPGLLVLSKSPLRQTGVVQFLPDTKQMTPRAYIKAVVDRVGAVVCTHMTADLGDFIDPLVGERYASTADQSIDEANQLNDLVQGLDQVVVMGDINAGPEITSQGIDPKFEESFDILVTNLASPYTQTVGMCTACSTNPLQGTDLKTILDHVLLKGYTAQSAQRLFDDVIDGKDYLLSDHYAVQVTATMDELPAPARKRMVLLEKLFEDVCCID